MPYPLSLEGKVALVVGGSGGVGQATGRMFAQAGARVVLTHRPGKDSDAAAKLPGDGHAAMPADVADTSSLLALREAIASRYGRLDILVNAAGFTKPVPHADLDALDDELIDRMFQVNWRGQFAAIRTFAPMLKEHGDGLVVSISSIAAFTAIGSSIAYCAAKAGIDVMTKALGAGPGAAGAGAGRLARRRRHRLRARPRRRFQRQGVGLDAAEAHRHGRRHRGGDRRLRHPSRLFDRHDHRRRWRPRLVERAGGAP